MEMPNKLPTVGDSSVEKTLRDIEDGIFDLSVEVQEGFDKTSKYYNLFNSHLDNIHEYLYSIQTILEKSFSLSQTQQQENQLALMRAKAEKPEEKKEKTKKLKKPEEDSKSFLFGLFSILGFTLGALTSLAFEYFNSKIFFLRKIFKSLDEFFLRVGGFFKNVKKTFNSVTDNFKKNVSKPISAVFKSFGSFFESVKKTFSSIKKSVSKSLQSIRVFFKLIARSIRKEFIVVSKTFSSFFDPVTNIFGRIKIGFFIILDSFLGFFKFFKKSFNLIRSFPIVGQVVGILVDFFIGIYKGFQKGLGVVGTLVSGLIQIVAGLFGGIPDLLFNILNFITKLFGFDMRSVIGDFSLERFIYDSLFTLFDFLTKDFLDPETWDFVIKLVDGFYKDLEYAFNDLTKWFSNRWENLKTDLFLYWQNIKFEFLNIWYSVSEWFGTKWDTLKTDLDLVWQDLKTMFTGLFSKTSEWLGTKFDTLKTDLDLVWQDLKNKFGIESVISSIMESISGFFTTFSEMFSMSNLMGMLLQTAKSLGAPDFVIDFLNSKVKSKEIQTKEREFDKALESGDLKKASEIRGFLKDVVSPTKLTEIQNKLVAGIKAEKLSKSLESTQNRNNEMKDKKFDQSQSQVITDQSVRQVNNKSTTVYQTQKDEEPLPRSMGGYLQPSM